MPITDVFLWHDVQKKLEEFNSHVRVLDSSVHDYTHAAGKLQVEIQVFAHVCLRVDVFEQLWEAIQVSENQFGQNHEVHWQGISTASVAIGLDAVIKEAEMTIKELILDLHTISRTYYQGVTECEERPVQREGALAENVAVKAQFLSNHFIKLLHVLLRDRLVNLVIILVINLLNLCGHVAHQNVHQKEAVRDEVWWGKLALDLALVHQTGSPAKYLIVRDAGEVT